MSILQPLHERSATSTHTSAGGAAGAGSSIATRAASSRRAAKRPAPVRTVVSLSAQPRWKASCAAQRVPFRQSSAGSPSAFQ